MKNYSTPCCTFCLFIIAFGLACSLLFSSCEYKELCRDHPHTTKVNITFDWSQTLAIGQSAEEELADIQAMSVNVYNNLNVTSDYFPYDLSGRLGGSLGLGQGDYFLLARNAGTESIRYKNMEKLETAEAYTRESTIEEGTELLTRSAPTPPNTEGQPIVLEPDMLWAGTSELLKIGVDDGELSTSISPLPRFVKFHVTFSNVQNLKYTAQFGASLSGVSQSVLLHSGKLSDQCAIIPFPMSSDGVSSLSGDFISFGHCPHKDEGVYNQHILTVYAVLADNQQWHYSVDVTDQIHDKDKNPSPYIINIEVSEIIPLPKPIVNGSGFHPEVDEWEDEEIYLGM